MLNLEVYFVALVLGIWKGLVPFKGDDITNNYGEFDPGSE